MCVYACTGVLVHRHALTAELTLWPSEDSFQELSLSSLLRRVSLVLCGAASSRTAGPHLSRWFFCLQSHWITDDVTAQVLCLELGK